MFFLASERVSGGVDVVSRVGRRSTSTISLLARLFTILLSVDVCFVCERKMNALQLELVDILNLKDVENLSLNAGNALVVVCILARVCLPLLAIFVSEVSLVDVFVWAFGTDSMVAQALDRTSSESADFTGTCDCLESALVMCES